VNFWRKDIGKKSVRKMLMKLTPVMIFTKPKGEGSFSPTFCKQLFATFLLPKNTKFIRELLRLTLSNKEADKMIKLAQGRPMVELF